MNKPFTLANRLITCNFLLFNLTYTNKVTANNLKHLTNSKKIAKLIYNVYKQQLNLLQQLLLRHCSYSLLLLQEMIKIVNRSNGGRNAARIVSSWRLVDTTDAADATCWHNLTSSLVCSPTTADCRCTPADCMSLPLQQQLTAGNPLLFLFIWVSGGFFTDFVGIIKIVRIVF